MNKSEHNLAWMLLAVRIIVGVILIGHGIQKILEQLWPTGHSETLWAGSTFPFVCFAPFIEVIGGGLIAAGIVIELGALLVVPAMLFAFFISHFGVNGFVGPANLRYVLNLVMLAIAIGICGPGKWALWDPGKSLRQRIFE